MAWDRAHDVIARWATASCSSGWTPRSDASARAATVRNTGEIRCGTVVAVVAGCCAMSGHAITISSRAGDIWPPPTWSRSSARPSNRPMRRCDRRARPLSPRASPNNSGGGPGACRGDGSRRGKLALRCRIRCRFGSIFSTRSRRTCLDDEGGPPAPRETARNGRSPTRRADVERWSMRRTRSTGKPATLWRRLADGINGGVGGQFSARFVGRYT